MSEAVFADTNLFIRYFTNDDIEQADAVERLFQQAQMGKCVLVVNEMIIAEIIWVLSSFYGLSRQDIRKTIWKLINTDGLHIASQNIVAQAIDIYASKNIDFVDAYSICWMQANDITAVYTFDQRHFSRVAGVDVKVPQ